MRELWSEFCDLHLGRECSRLVSNVRVRWRGIAAHCARLHKRRRCCRVHAKARTGVKGSGCGLGWDGASSGRTGLCVDTTGGAQDGVGCHSHDTRRLSTFTLLHQVYFRRLISLTTAVRQSPIAYLPHLMHLSLSFLALYISVRSSMSHHSLPFVCFLCPILSSPSPSTLVSSIFILTSVDPTLVIPYIPYDPFPIIQIILIITTPRTCINTLSTRCCSSV